MTIPTSGCNPSINVPAHLMVPEVVGPPDRPQIEREECELDENPEERSGSKEHGDSITLMSRHIATANNDNVGSTIVPTIS